MARPLFDSWSSFGVFPQWIHVKNTAKLQIKSQNCEVNLLPIVDRMMPNIRFFIVYIVCLHPTRHYRSSFLFASKLGNVVKTVRGFVGHRHLRDLDRVQGCLCQCKDKECVSSPTNRILTYMASCMTS
eukprot:230180_1